MDKINLISYKNSENFLETISRKCLEFDSSKKTILFVEPYGAVISLLKRGLSKDYNIIILTANSDFRIVSGPMLDAAKLAIEVDTADEDGILDVIKSLQEICIIDGVVPGFEYFVPLVAKISHYLHVPGIDPNDVMKLRRKDLMRLTLKKSDITMPQFRIINSIDELYPAIEEIGFPAICKPVDAAGSVNVKKVTNVSEAVTAATRILEGNDVLWGHKLSKRLLFEEYIEGKEYSLEGIVQNGNIIHFSLTEKFVSDEYEFVEVGHIVNAPMENGLKCRIEGYVENIIKALNADNCPFHAEIRINADGQPVLMEIAARLAGDKIGDLINIARNINYFDAVFSTYLGETIRQHELDNLYAGIRFFYRPHVGVYSSVCGVEEAKTRPIEEIFLYYNKDQVIPSFPKPLRRLGHVIMKSHDYDYLLKTLIAVDESIIFNY